MNKDISMCENNCLDCVMIYICIKLLDICVRLYVCFVCFVCYCTDVWGVCYMDLRNLPDTGGMCKSPNQDTHCAHNRPYGTTEMPCMLCC